MEPERPGLLLAAGGSEFGSHGIRMLHSCPRSYWLSGACGTGPQPSRRDGSVELLSDDGVIWCEPPGLKAQEDRLDSVSVWMQRGTLVHVALGHLFVLEALRHDGAIVVCGNAYGAEDSERWYTPEEAIEAMALLLGRSCWTYALGATRRLLPQLRSWVTQRTATHKPAAIETQLAWNVDGPWRYTARFDLIEESRASRRLFGLDYKTSSHPAKDLHKYDRAGQLHGQDQMGRKWAGDEQWGGVSILLIEDNPGKVTGSMIQLELPPWGPARYLGQFVTETVRRAGLWKESGDWPRNPYHCQSCQLTEVCRSKA